MSNLKIHQNDTIHVRAKSISVSQLNVGGVNNTQMNLICMVSVFILFYLFVVDRGFRVYLLSHEVPINPTAILRSQIPQNSQQLLLKTFL